MGDVWWGLVETSPQEYEFSGYSDLLDLVKQNNLKLQAVMSFHQCGGNVGDDCDILLPSWVVSVGYSNPDIFYIDRENNVNFEVFFCTCTLLFFQFYFSDQLTVHFPVCG